MGKLLVTFSDPQEAWLREEAARLGLPGGVSELVRRAVDDYRGDEMRTPSIPDTVIEKIIAHRPHLKPMTDNLMSHPNFARQIEKAIADAYLAGETHLSGPETWKLSFCTVGQPYGGNPR